MMTPLSIGLSYLMLMCGVGEGVAAIPGCISPRDGVTEMWFYESYGEMLRNTFIRAFSGRLWLPGVHLVGSFGGYSVLVTRDELT